MVGRKVSVAEVLDEVTKDTIFYDESGGGVTFSGGEPLAQPEFLVSLVKACREMGIHTAIDTSGYGSPDTLLEVADHADLILYDIKSLRDDVHQQVTGVDNSLILSNLRRLAAHPVEVIVRVPLIPGVNDADRDIELMAEFLSGLEWRRQVRVDLLPYHRIGMDKYERLGRVYAMAEAQPPSREQLDRVLASLRGHGFITRIGG
jgi:pyruvate formate lyase activating enzyme